MSFNIQHSPFGAATKAPFPFGTNATSMQATSSGFNSASRAPSQNVVRGSGVSSAKVANAPAFGAPAFGAPAPAFGLCGPSKINVLVKRGLRTSPGFCCHTAAAGRCTRGRQRLGRQDPAVAPGRRRRRGRPRGPDSRWPVTPGPATRASDPGSLTRASGLDPESCGVGAGSLPLAA